MAVSAPVDCEPLVAFVPDQPPDATHELASVEDQLRVEDSPASTLAGLTVRVTVGGGVGTTVTVAEALALPPEPVQVRVKVVEVAKAPVDVEPLVMRLPLHPPDAVHEVAFVDDQSSVEAPPLPTLVGLTRSMTAGSGGGGALLPLSPPPQAVSIEASKPRLTMGIVRNWRVARMEPLREGLEWPGGWSAPRPS